MSWTGGYSYGRGGMVPGAATARTQAPAPPPVAPVNQNHELDVKRAVREMKLTRVELESLLVSLVTENAEARRFVDGYMDIMAAKSLRADSA